MSDDTFTASNGLEIKPEADRLAVRSYLAIGGTIDRLFPERDVTALREYFQWERDQELGRWRDPENLDRYVRRASVGVKPGRGNRRWVTVTDERDGCEFELAEDYEFAGMGDYWDTTRRYFAAHPEPKPWENAEPGEVWVLTVAGQDQVYRCGQNGLYGLADGQPLRALTGMFVTGGRRIWPEPEADDE